MCEVFAQSTNVSGLHTTLVNIEMAMAAVFAGSRLLDMEPATWTVVPFYKRGKLHHEHNIPQSHSYDSLQLYKAVFGFKDHT